MSLFLPRRRNARDACLSQGYPLEYEARTHANTQIEREMTWTSVAFLMSLRDDIAVF